ncbi:MAG TPA: flagellar assembly peptidoglycan hydrolase FlgJ [Casimicrobiaceae bacterium]
MDAPSSDVTARFALDAGALSALREQAKTAPDKALSAAATQFEAVFLQMMMKSMRAATPQDGPLDSDATKMYTSMFDDQIAQTMAKHGTGLGKLIEAQLSRSLPTKPADAGTDAGAGATAAAGKAMPLHPSAGKAMSLHPSAAKAMALHPTRPAMAIPRNASKGMPIHVPTTSSAAGAYARTAADAAPGSVSSAKPAAKSAPTTSATSAKTASWLPDSIQAFVDKLRPAAEAAARAVGLPVQYLLAQAGLETGWGKHQPKSAATGDSHNLFGIKAGQAWKGKVVETSTHEVVGGTLVATKAKFRSYDSYETAFGDFAKMIGSSHRYAKALAQGADPAAYASALQKGGYATDPAYAAKLTRAIRSVTPLVEASAAAPTLEASAAAPTQVSAAAVDIRSMQA